MDAIALHLEIRNALSLSDELARHAHANHGHSLAGHLSSTRSLLATLERDVGRTHLERISPNPTLIEKLDHALAVLRDRTDEFPLDVRPRFGLLLEALERVVYAELRPSADVPAKPMLNGALPLKRVVPQDAHSVVDYLAAGAYLASAALARTSRGRAVGLALGSSTFGMSLLTDDRLSAKRVLSIETHEVLDHATGASAIVAPFVLGYVKKDPIAAALQIAFGLSSILTSLFTDYRAVRGVSRPIRSKGGPEAPRRGRGGRGGLRVPEVQKPLEGLAGPSDLEAVGLRVT